MNIVLTELYELNRAKPARARKRDSSTSHDAAKRAEADTATAWQRTSIKAAVYCLDGALACMNIEDALKEQAGLFAEAA